MPSLESNVLERPAAPQLERLREQARGPGCVAVRRGGSPCGDERLEAVQIRRGRIDDEAVPAGTRLDPQFDAMFGEDAAQA